jgi:hypothetical protein
LREPDPSPSFQQKLESLFFRRRERREKEVGFQLSLE